MLLHKYLVEIIGSKVKVKMLRTLFRHAAKVFTGRELAAATGASKSAVAEALRDLEAMNVIRVEHHGQSNLINLNKDNAVFGDLKNLFENESEMFNKFRSELIRLVPPSTSCAIFGSVSKGTERPNSDVDLLYITNDKREVEKFIEEKHGGFLRRYGNTIMPVIMSKSEFVRKRNMLFVKNILENYVMVTGEDLSKILEQQK